MPETEAGADTYPNENAIDKKESAGAEEKHSGHKPDQQGRPQNRYAPDDA